MHSFPHRDRVGIRPVGLVISVNGVAASVGVEERT